MQSPKLLRTTVYAERLVTEDIDSEDRSIVTLVVVCSKATVFMKAHYSFGVDGI